MLSLSLILSLAAAPVQEAELPLPANADAGVRQMLSEYFPALHKPNLLHNKVYVFADIYYIIELNERQETLTTKLWMYMAYFVEGVPQSAWDERVSPNVSMVFLYPGQVWKPDIIIQNNIGTYGNDFPTPFIRRNFCKRSGQFCPMVVHAYPLVQATACAVDVVHFPYDTQYCPIEIGPWVTEDEPGSPGYEVQPLHQGSGMMLSSFQRNSQWHLKRAPLDIYVRHAVSNVQFNYTSIRYVLEMKRLPKFYECTLIAPCALLSMLTVLSVFLPVESGEKMSLGITVMLAQVVNLLILSNIVPTSSRYFPYLGLYFLTTILFIAVALVYNSLIISSYYSHKSPLHLLIFKYLHGKRNDSKQKEDLASLGEQNGTSDELLRKLHPSPSQPDERGWLHMDTDTGPQRDHQAFCTKCDRVFGCCMLAVGVVIHVAYFAPYVLRRDH